RSTDFSHFSSFFQSSGYAARSGGGQLPQGARCPPVHSLAPVVRPRAMSNSLSSGTSIAKSVKPKAPAMTKNGISGSDDSGLPGWPTSTLMTQERTGKGQNRPASVRAADGRLPLSTHHSPLTPATANTKKLVH